MNKIFKKLLMFSLAIAGVTFVSCTDNEPPTESYYTFKGEMVSDYLRNRPQFSMFKTIVERAGLMDQMSAYGTYTCFAPTNDAVTKFLNKRGQTLDDLTFEDCDTLARTHLLSNMYTTAEMGDGTLPTPNMIRRYLQISPSLDADSNAVIRINKMSQIIFTMQDDSVENGIMQPVDAVIQSSTEMVGDLLLANPEISIYVEALIVTGLKDSLYKYRDNSYNPKDYVNTPGDADVQMEEGWAKYISHVNPECAKVPDEKKAGFTVFVVPDETLYKNGYIDSTAEKSKLEQLYDLACKIYDEVYPEDKDKEYHKFNDEALTHRKNPLNRFMAYHILNRKQEDFNLFTSYGRHMTTEAFKNMGVVTRKINPQEWYETLCPFTMMKIEKSTVIKHFAGDKSQRHYINRRIDDIYPNGSGSTGGIIKNDQHGAMIIAPGQSSHELADYSYTTVGPNGCYYLLDDIIAFDKRVRDIVFNCRVRMDINTIFPELDTEGIRLNGDETHQGSDYDKSGKDGYNYWFPNGYLAGVKSTGFFIYRRPRNHYDSYQGDEFNMFGNYDITFRLPPCFPSAGDYQIRMGFAQESTRGIAQVYFDNQPQGIPLDMTITSSDPRIGMTFPDGGWDSYSEEEKQAERKALKNKGYYRGPAGICRANGNTALWVDNGPTYRMVLCTVHISDPNEYHYLRFRNVSDNGKTEFMLDWLEVVPKSVYGITDEGIPEDDL